MVIIKITRKPLKIAVIVILICSLGFNIYSTLESAKIKNTYESVMCILNQFNKSSLVSFLVSSDALPQEYKNIEIFDINRGEVIKTVQSDSTIQKEVEGYLKEITGMYVKIKAFPDKGYIIRVPLEPSVKVQSHWLNDYGINFVNEVFVLFPENGGPYLLILDEKKRPLFYNFIGNTDVLLEKLKFKLKTSQ